MGNQLKPLLALLLFALLGAMQTGWASDDQLMDAVRQLIRFEPKPCADNKSCYCTKYSTQHDLSLRYTEAQYCRTTSLPDGSFVVQFTALDGHNKKVDEGTFVGGKMHGPWISWYPNGIRSAESTFEHGKQTGTFTTWHENGQVAITGQHVDDKPHGVWLYRDANGKIEKSFEWNHGKIVSKKVSN